MNRLTDIQASSLESLRISRVCSASWFDRHAYEALVKKGLAVKHWNGRMVTYTLAEGK